MPLAIHESWTHALALATPSARARLMELIPTDPELSFVDFALQLIDSGSPAAGTVVQSGVLPGVAIDPSACSLPDAIRLIKAADPAERTLDVKIVQLAGAANDPKRVMRALELVDAVSDCRRLVIPLLKFAKAPDANIRSKAIKLMARASQNGAWLESILNDHDPRVRSNLIEGLFAQLGSECTPLLKRAARDPHHRVATTALLCLARLGDASSREQLEQLTGDERDLHARAAMWALKQLESATPSNTTPHPNA